MKHEKGTCPHCGSGNIDYPDLEYAGDAYIEHGICLDCDGRHKDIFKYTKTEKEEI